MNCKVCKATKFKTVDTRRFGTFDYPNGIKRRRECKNCGHRFTTVEADVSELRSRIMKRAMVEIEHVKEQLGSAKGKIEQVMEGLIVND